MAIEICQSFVSHTAEGKAVTSWSLLQVVAFTHGETHNGQFTVFLPIVFELWFFWPVVLFHLLYAELWTRELVLSSNILLLR